MDVSILPETLCRLGAGFGDVVESDPGLGMMMVIIAIGFLAAAGCVLLFLALVLLALLGLVGVGILSASALTAVFTRSAGAGFKTLLALCGLVAGGGTAGIVAIIAHRLMGVDFTILLYIAIIAVGAAGGALSGLLLHRVLSRFAARLFRHKSGRQAR